MSDSVSAPTPAVEPASPLWDKLCRAPHLSAAVGLLCIAAIACSISPARHPELGGASSVSTSTDYRIWASELCGAQGWIYARVLDVDGLGTPDFLRVLRAGLAVDMRQIHPAFQERSFYLVARCRDGRREISDRFTIRRRGSHGETRVNWASERDAFTKQPMRPLGAWWTE